MPRKVSSDDDLDWWNELDSTCYRFLGLTLEQASIELLEEDLESGLTPEEFFVHCVVPQLKEDHGDAFINETIAEQVIWGAQRPAVLRYQRELIDYL